MEYDDEKIFPLEDEEIKLKFGKKLPWGAYEVFVILEEDGKGWSRGVQATSWEDYSDVPLKDLVGIIRKKGDKTYLNIDLKSKHL